ncbi:hypothetical protein L596_015568 [Steinernema carpocapsae]|uniref:Death domain-containing protein n=1 Tax=Steinernema carpocapsae TaxID=34508 RepID=A0A4U5NG04_STECR|nr:hypothetical protein L596_015568 [Steinernema carpocapsae]
MGAQIELSRSEATAGDELWIYANFAITQSTVIAISSELLSIKLAQTKTHEKLAVVVVPKLDFKEDTKTKIMVANSENEKAIAQLTYLTRDQVPNTTNMAAIRKFAQEGDPIVLLRPLFSNLFEKDDLNCSILHIAAKNQQSFALRTFLRLLQENGSYALVNEKNSRGETPLHLAILASDQDSTHYLIQAGASVNVQDHLGNTPVHYLTKIFEEDLYQELLEETGEAVNWCLLNNDGNAAIHLAVKGRKLALVDLMLDQGCLINLPDKNGYTPIMYALMGDDSDVIECLLQRNCDIHWESSDGQTPLLIAAEARDYDLVGRLLDLSADANKENKKGVSLKKWTEKEKDDQMRRIIDGDRLKKVKSCPVLEDDIPPSSSQNGGESSAAALVRKYLPDSKRFSESSEDEADQPGGSGSVLNKEKFGDKASYLDYVTRLRLAKILDVEDKWVLLARTLNCEHMIDFIRICADDSSPTLILLDQYEQIPDAKISTLTESLEKMEDEPAIACMKNRFKM